MCANMIYSLRRFSDVPVVVYCDDEAQKELKAYIGNTTNVEIKNTDCKVKNFNHYGSENFVELCFKRIEHLIDDLKNTSDDFVMVDTDVVFTSDPMGHLEIIKYKTDYDFVFQTDRPTGSTICNGFFYIRNTERIVNFFTKFLHLSVFFREKENGADHREIHDQFLMNQILIYDFPLGRELNSMVKWTLFPTSFATNGHLYFSVNEVHGSEIVIHCNFAVGKQDKVKRLKSKNLWFMGEK